MHAPTRPFRRKLARSLTAYLLLAPAILIAAIFVYFPSLYVLRLSLFKWDLISPTQTFVGLSNYVRLFSPDSDFWNSLFRTLEYCAIYIPLSLAAGLLLAILLTRIDFLKGFFQSVYFIPSITSISVVSVVWSYLYNPQIGPLNQVLTQLGVPHNLLPQWLNSPQLALPCLAVTGAWQSLGLVSLLFMAGLSNIPKDFREAAAVDGASEWTNFWSITFPLLSPVTFFVLFMLLIDSFRVFGIVAIMTQGRPLDSTNVLLYNIYQNAFQYFDSGFASAGSWITFLVIFLLMILQQKLGNKSVFYQ